MGIVMSEWKGLSINSNHIKATTDSACKITMPYNSEYSGYSFWHPQSCIFDDFMSNKVQIRYTDTFEFRLKKYGKGKNNRFEVLDAKTVGAAEIEEAFSNEIVYVDPEEADKPRIHVPEKKEPEKAVVPEELRDE